MSVAVLTETALRSSAYLTQRGKPRSSLEHNVSIGVAMVVLLLVKTMMLIINTYLLDTIVLAPTYLVLVCEAVP